ncbi:MAG: HisA/HisF-related TIM barrel protein, partial [Aquiluna sp.]
MHLELLPAVDVASGKAVRLTQGEAGSEEDFGHPLDAAKDRIAAGAEWIHLVDLDAAFGRGSNREVISEVVANAGSTKIELSG